MFLMNCLLQTAASHYLSGSGSEVARLQGGDTHPLKSVRVRDCVRSTGGWVRKLLSSPTPHVKLSSVSGGGAGREGGRTSRSAPPLPAPLTNRNSRAGSSGGRWSGPTAGFCCYIRADCWTRTAPVRQTQHSLNDK